MPQTEVGSELSSTGKISQRSWGQNRGAELLDDKVRVTFSAGTDFSAYFVRYEDVVRDPIEFVEQRNGGQIFEGISWGLTGLLAFLVAKDWADYNAIPFVVTGLCALPAIWIRIGRYFPRRRLVQLSIGEPVLVLFQDRPGRTEVAEFVSALYERSTDYIRATYGSAASHESKAGQLDRIFQLWERGALTEEEFQSLKRDIVAVPEIQTGQYV